MPNAWLNYGGKGLNFGTGIKVSVHVLPPIAQKTLRFDFKYDHFDPTTGLTDRSDIGATWTHVADDVYDFHFDNSVWYCKPLMSPTGNAGGLFNIYSYRESSSIIFPMSTHSFDIIDSNLSGVTDAHSLMTSARMCANCVLKNTGDIVDASYMLSGGNRPISLATLNALDLHSATNISHLLYSATSLISPLDITLSGAVSYCDSAFYNCKKVSSGALALYNSLSSQSALPTNYSGTFTNCGANTTTGAAELAQIPSSWGGTGA